MANLTLPNKTAEFFYKLSKIVFFCGMPNFWIEDLNMSKKITKSYLLLSQIVAGMVYIFLAFEWAAFLTHQNLSEKQKLDLLMYGLSHPMLWSYTVVLSHHSSKIRKTFSDILQMKKVFSDTKVEEQMVKKSKLYSLAFIFSCVLSMTMYTFDSISQVILKGTTFTTVVTAWPDVENNSIPANICRAIWNFCWWAMIIRVLGVYAVVFSLTTSLSHQFIDLQKYFYSLETMFDTESLDQRDVEIKYENAFKIGIKLFNSLMHCFNQSKAICGSVFSGQIIFNIILLVIFMIQFINSAHNLMVAGAIVLAATTVLIGTGLFMCNAGDVTVEASRLATAMYSSGWQHCQGRSSYRVRQLVVVSMMVAQKPVVIMGLGIMELSYQNYVSLVKSSYSVFSLLI